MNETIKTLHFSIDGQFITKLAREKLYYNNDFKSAIELLMACLRCDGISDTETLGRAMKILNGQAEIRGVYPGDDYGYYETDENADLMSEITEKLKEVEKLRKENNELAMKLSFIEANIGYSKGKILQQSYEEDFDGLLFSEDGEFCNPMQMENSVIRAVTEQLEAKQYENNYGWLEPSGKFHPVEWGNHTKWAADYLLEHFENELEINMLSANDTLIEKGWILLHNPGMGLPMMTKSDNKSITKAQANFLYDFFEERNMHAKAKEIMQYEYIT